MRSKVQKPNGVCHIDGNILPSDLKRHLPDPVFEKLKLNYTGSDPLCHPDESDLVEKMLENAKELFKVT